ncbi:TetR/AcrR family transcriptional regulator [Amycolatopsis regifaucium]|uniref:TetR family transcriptional regulator n=1 Tax=Amycolatopsis regifaucium TaxID=546365 RepID=A0A154M5Q5_9PSEU|nr:TetR/AcrR family transcriptional regulator [Amycolatopsis regifaucium]KZB79823.1 TetR family transcriptional regulator [Amycolatopsis regifaucium]OKA09859.1 TetR family transcriptional regulator [Amycolatopsis regifaucium]SFJ33019.1 DNA-binding transcriptional regulator, AcrR family [Amycolatopsis regifaucium]
MAPRKAAALRDSEDGRSLREHLIATAAKLISLRGTAELTVRAIAREAGVADGVLYNHFADKEELLANALAEHVRTVERGLGALPEPGSGTVEANLGAQLAYGLALHKEILPAFAGLLARPAVLARFGELAGDGANWRDRLAGYLGAEKELGRISGDVEAATAMLVGVCHETVLSGLFPHGPKVVTAPAVDAVVATVLAGIAGR